MKANNPRQTHWRPAATWPIVGALILSGVSPWSSHRNAGELATTELGETPPPREYRLEVDGKVQIVYLDKPFEIGTGENKQTLKFYALPDRLLDFGDFEFRCSTQHAYEFDDSDEELTIWTLDGSNNVLTVMRFPEEMDPEELGASLAESIAIEYGLDNVDFGDGTIQLEGKEVAGIRLEVDVMGYMLVQELFTFNGKGNSYALMIQDSVNEDGSRSQETKETIERMEKTFKMKK